MAVDVKMNEKGQSDVTNETFKSRIKKDKSFQTKVVIRRLPPSMTEEQFVEQLSPLPEHDYMYFVKGDMRLGPHAVSRAYINFLIPEDIFIFKDKFDGYVFLDNKGNEYPAIVEFAPFQKTPKRRSKKRDAKCGTISNDPDYLKFLESIENPDEVPLQSAEAYLEEVETREKEMKANNGGLKMTTPLIEFLKARKIEQQKIREEKREERKRKELEKKRIREEERRRRKAEKEQKEKEKNKEKDSLSEKEVTDEHEESTVSETQKQTEPNVVQVLKNPEREKEQKETPIPQKCKDYVVSSRVNRDKDKGRKEWERVRLERKEKPRPRVFYMEKDRNQTNKKDYRYSKCENETSTKKHKDDSKETDQSGQKNLPSPKVVKAFKGYSYKNDRKYDRKEVHSTRKQNEDLKDPAIQEVGPVIENIKVPSGQLSDSKDQYASKDKRGNSCPGNIESQGSSDLPSAQSKISLQSANSTETSDMSKSDNYDGKDPRTERRIRNKDRPSIEIYRPGMRRVVTQRNSPQKEMSTSASNSSSPSPTPSASAKTVGESGSKSEE